MSATRDLVLVKREGGTATLILNSPRNRNVLSAELVTQLGQAMDEIEADPELRCVVVTGAGPAFCAGADLATLAAAADGRFDLVRRVYDGFLRILRTPLVTVAAVNGPAVGAGFNLALACDVRLAGSSARFVSRFADLSIHPGGGHLWLLARAVGPQRAQLAALFGEEWGAAQAWAVGLVAEILPDAELIDHAVAMGRRLDGQEAEYTRRLVDSARRSIELTDHTSALDLEAVAQEWSTTRPAFRARVEEIRRRVGR